MQSTVHFRRWRRPRLFSPAPQSCPTRPPTPGDLGRRGTSAPRVRNSTRSRMRRCDPRRPAGVRGRACPRTLRQRRRGPWSRRCEQDLLHHAVNPSRNHVLSGTGKPIFLRVRILLGSICRIAFLTRYLPSEPRSLNCGGTWLANSTTW